MADSKRDKVGRRKFLKNATLGAAALAGGAQAGSEEADLDEVVDAFENRIGPRNGAEVVARAWVDPEYKARLLEDGTAAIAELGFGGSQGEHMV